MGLVLPNNPFRQKIRDPQKEDHKKIWLPEGIYVYLGVNEIITTKEKSYVSKFDHYRDNQQGAG
jgi:hypothetical protein